ncbi:MAG: YciI family protein [Gemmatimonadetes bacterium]|nr:YciI family protein [Gemmatimonadota bacterium]
MRFMMIVKGSEETEAGAMPTDAQLAEMGRFREELARAGVLLDASGLKPTSSGWKVKYDRDGRSIVDGPFTETKELVAGYTLIEVKTREEAIEWSRRFPCAGVDGVTGEIEVRELFEPDDFERGPGVAQLRELQLPSQR